LVLGLWSLPGPTFAWKTFWALFMERGKHFPTVHRFRVAGSRPGCCARGGTGFIVCSTSQSP
jgi:hypothetical protein